MGTIYVVSSLLPASGIPKFYVFCIYSLYLFCLFIFDTFFPLTLPEARTCICFLCCASAFSASPLRSSPSSSDFVLPTNRLSSLGAYLESCPPPPFGDFVAIPCGGTARGEGGVHEGGGRKEEKEVSKKKMERRRIKK